MTQSRGAKKRERTRADLLAAARKVFAQRGYHDTSIADITRTADVGVGTFYLHFRDKEEIFTILFEEALTSVHEQVLREVQQEGPPSLKLVVRTIMQHAYEERDLFRIGLTGGGQFAHLFQVQDRLAQGFQQFLEDFGTPELSEKFIIPLLAHLIAGVLIQGMIWWFEQDEPAPAEMAEQIIHLLASGLPASLFEEHETDQTDHE